HGHLQEHGPETVGVIKVAGRKASALQCREGFIHVFVLPGPDRDQAPYITLPNSRLETQFSEFARSPCRSGRPWLEQNLGAVQTFKAVLELSGGEAGFRKCEIAARRSRPVAPPGHPS